MLLTYMQENSQLDSLFIYSSVDAISCSELKAPNSRMISS